MTLVQRTSRSLEGAAVLGLLGVALLLRVTGLGAGAPFVYHPDEWAIVQPALTMIRTLDWNPHWFDWPSLSIYAYLPVAIAVRLLSDASLATPSGHASDGLRLYDPSDALPEQFSYFLYGRLLVALLGVATVGLVYLAARWQAGPAAGLTAGGFMAVANLHVTQSRVLTPDVPSTILAAGVLLMTVIAVRAKSTGWFLAAGLAAGLAGSAKWNALATVVVPLGAWLAVQGADGHAVRRALKVAVGIAACAVLGLAIGTPALLFDNASVMAAIEGVRQHYFVVGHPGAEGADNAAYYLDLLFRSGLGPGLSLLAGIGIVVGLLRRRATELASVLLVLVYFALTAASVVRFERNLLPMLPYLAFLAGTALVTMTAALASALGPIARRPGSNRFAVSSEVSRHAAGAIAGVALVAAVLPQAVSAWHEGLRMDLTDTRTVAHEWITTNVPSGSRIVREDYTPQLYGPGLDVRYVDSLAERSLDWYQQHGYSLAVASSYRYARYFDGLYPEIQRAYERLFEKPLLYEICPDAVARGPCIRVIDLLSTNTSAEPP